MVISFKAQCRRTDALSSSDHHARFDNALSRLSNRDMGQGEVVGYALPMQKDLSDTSELTDLLHAVGGLISKSLPVVKAPRRGLCAFLHAILTPQQREPLP